MEEEPDDDVVWDHESLSFDDLIDVLRGWHGQTVGLTCQGPPSKRGNTTLHVRGVLLVDEDLEVGVIDSRGGRIEAFRIGDGQVQMLQGDFHGAEVITDPADGAFLVSADFREVGLNFTGPPQEQSAGR